MYTVPHPNAHPNDTECPCCYNALHCLSDADQRIADLEGQLKEAQVNVAYYKSKITISKPFLDSIRAEARVDALQEGCKAVWELWNKVHSEFTDTDGSQTTHGGELIFVKQKAIAICDRLIAQEQRGPDQAEPSQDAGESNAGGAG